MADDALAAILDRAARRELSPQIAIMELLIESEDAHVVERCIAERVAKGGEPAVRELAALCARHREGCARLAAILRAEQPDHEQARSLDEGLGRFRQLFDALVGQSEEASVAFYSLGSPEILAEATREIEALLLARGYLSPAARVLDVGCGIGRMEVALAPHVGEIEGIDLSPGMVKVAERRTAHLENVRIACSSGRDLSGIASAAKSLVLAIDSFPYVVQAGQELVDGMFAEVSRVLEPGGRFVILNYSYRGQLELDCRDAQRLAARYGFVPEALGERPFRLWNGSLFAFLRP